MKRGSVHRTSFLADLFLSLSFPSLLHPSHSQAGSLHSLPPHLINSLPVPMADNSCDSHTIQVDELLDTDSSSSSSDTASPSIDGVPEHASASPQPAAHLVANPSLALPPMVSSNIHGNTGLSSGFALPASNPFTDSNEPVNPFTPSGTPLDTPMATPPGSPAQALRKLSLGVERYAKAIEDPGPIGSFSGTVPLPSLSQTDHIASRRRPSHAVLDVASSMDKGDSNMARGSSNGDGSADTSSKSTGLNLKSIKKALSGNLTGRHRIQDLSMADLESNMNSEKKDSLNDLGNPFGGLTASSNNDAQAALFNSLSLSPQPLLLPVMSSATPLQEALNESRPSENDEILRRLDQSRKNQRAATSTNQEADTDPAVRPGMRRRKPRGGILSQLLKLQRNEAAAAAAATSGSSTGAKRSNGQMAAAQHTQVKKTKKGFYYRSSSKNNSLTDLGSASVTSTPRVSPRNSRIFDSDPSHTMRLPTQPSTSINNTNLPFAKPDPREAIEEMETISAAATAATLSANLGIQRDIAEILTRQSFLIMMAKALILYGAPSHRIEETCALLARKMDVDASFALLPGLMTISFSDPETHTSDTRHLRCTQGMDMYKLSEVYTIAWGVLHGKDIEEANKSLEKVTVQPGYYPVWVTVMAWMTAAAFVAPLAFNGSWLDTLLAGLCGLLVGVLGLVAAKFPIYGNVFEVTSSILVGFIAKAFGDRVCFSAVALAGVVVLLPGLLLTQAIMELASRNIVSGAVRMFYALMYAFFLGFGLSLGAELWDAVSSNPLHKVDLDEQPSRLLVDMSSFVSL